MPLAVFVMLCGASSLFTGLPVAFWLLAVALSILTSLAPFFVIREIRFLEEMVIRRYFLPDLFFTHQEIEQINPDSIQAGGRRIRMGQVSNLAELREMAHRWKAARILKAAQHEQPAPIPIFPMRGYGMYASFWGILFGTLVLLLIPPDLRFDPRWLLGGTFLLVYVVYIYVIPRIL